MRARSNSDITVPHPYESSRIGMQNSTEWRGLLLFPSAPSSCQVVTRMSMRVFYTASVTSTFSVYRLLQPWDPTVVK